VIDQYITNYFLLIYWGDSATNAPDIILVSDLRLEDFEEGI
jgi:hypothetical protein